MDKFELAKSEAGRIAAEHGVPCYPTRDPNTGVRTPELARASARCGIACGVASRCNPFGIAPAGYYEDDGRLICVCYPVPFREDWLPEVHAEIAAGRQAFEAANAAAYKPS